MAGIVGSISPGIANAFSNAANSVAPVDYNGLEQLSAQMGISPEQLGYQLGLPGYLKTNTGGATGGGSGGGGGGGGGTAEDVSFLNDQEAQLRGLLGRTDTDFNNGLTKNENDYQTQVGGANADKQRQYANYADQRVGQNKAKVNAYETIDQNANQGYQSLANIIGRRAGTGSSAYRELLPNVVGKDTSTRRSQASTTYGENLAGIDNAQNQYDISFRDVLDDLMKQKKVNEQTLRTGYEGQKQDLLNKIGGVQGQRQEALGGNYAAVKAARAGTDAQIENSRNAVEGFFNQFNTPYVAKQAVAAKPDLSQYTTDRAAINAGQQGGDASNPYAALLRKKLQGGA